MLGGHRQEKKYRETLPLNETVLDLCFLRADQDLLHQVLHQLPNRSQAIRKLP